MIQFADHRAHWRNRGQQPDVLPTGGGQQARGQQGNHCRELSLAAQLWGFTQGHPALFSHLWTSMTLQVFGQAGLNLWKTNNFLHSQQARDSWIFMSFMLMAALYTNIRVNMCKLKGITRNLEIKNSMPWKSVKDFHGKSKKIWWCLFLLTYTCSFPHFNFFSPFSVSLSASKATSMFSLVYDQLNQ